MIDEVINFFQSFDKYKDTSKEDLKYHLEPSFHFQQYKIFGNEQITGFLNWAFLNDRMKMKFLNHGIIDYGNWRSGDNLCFVHLVCRKDIRDMINWAKKHFWIDLGYPKEVSWIRIGNEIDKRMKVNNRWLK